MTGPWVPQSRLRRGLRALEELSVRPRTAAEVAREIGVNRSTALRILQELEAAGYLVRDGSSKRFSTVTERLYALVVPPDDHWDWVELIHPVLASNRDRFGEASMHAVPANGSMVYLAFFPSHHPIAVRERIGTERPMHSSALGKAYLSALDPKSLDLELGRLSYEGGTDRAARGPLELGQRVADARKRGYALDREETFEGVVCLAVPTRISGALIGSAGVSGPANRLPEARIEEIAHALINDFSSLNRRV
jgi:IclR family acetate operon transcriptional repressor